MFRLWDEPFRVTQVCVGRPRSGKTSLLDILGGRRRVGRSVYSFLTAFKGDIRGTVTLNGQAVGKSMLSENMLVG